MDDEDAELKAALAVLDRHGERAGDFRFRRFAGPAVTDASGHTEAQQHIEVTTKRRGVRIAHYVDHGRHEWLQQFEADVQRRRFRPEGD